MCRHAFLNILSITVLITLVEINHAFTNTTSNDTLVDMVDMEGADSLKIMDITDENIIGERYTGEDKVGSSDPVHYLTVCHAGYVYMDCGSSHDSGTIHVLEAWYGRSAKPQWEEICSMASGVHSDCNFNVTNEVRSGCEGQVSCSYNILRVHGDKCHLTEKLDLAYTCSPGHHTDGLPHMSSRDADRASKILQHLHSDNVQNAAAVSEDSSRDVILPLTVATCLLVLGLVVVMLAVWRRKKTRRVPRDYQVQKLHTASTDDCHVLCSADNI